MVLKTMNEYRNVEFVETEFRPQAIQRAYPGAYRVGKGDNRSGAAEDKQHLIKTHSGFPAKLKTLNGAGDELNDLEKGLSDSEVIVGRKARVKEIV
jgi:hypothetical protein